MHAAHTAHTPRAQDQFYLIKFTKTTLYRASSWKASVLLTRVIPSHFFHHLITRYDWM